MTFKTRKSDGRVFNDNRKRSDEHHGSVSPRSGVKLNTRSSTDQVGELNVLPVYRNYIREHYPEMIENVNDVFWMGTSSGMGRLGKYDDIDRWNLTSKKVLKLSPEGSAAIGFDKKYMTENEPELYKMHLDLERKGLNATVEERDAFLKKYAEYQAREDNERFKKYKMKQKAFVRKTGDKYEVVHTIAPDQLFLDDVEAGKIKDERGMKLSFNQVQGKRPNSGGLNNVNAHIVCSDGGCEKKQRMNDKIGNYVGEVISIDDLDKSLPYKSWEVITKIIDDYHYEVGDRYGRKTIIRDTDIRSAIGDMKNDFTGIGKERHAEEVVPIIRKNMEIENVQN